MVVRKVKIHKVRDIISPIKCSAYFLFFLFILTFFALVKAEREVLLEFLYFSVILTGRFVADHFVLL